MPKAIGLISGGLDSMLAALLIKDQGIDILGVNFYTGFCITETQKRKRHQVRNPAEVAAEIIGIPLRIIDISQEYMELVTNPKYGYGKNSNPCIDCRIMMLRKAKEIMERENADFVFTGEVVGERPMTQRMPQLKLIEKESGLEGYLLRPLSAKLLPPTIPEKKGIVDRSKLLGIRGRSRKPQLELAQKYGLEYIPQPAGGCCFLTDETFARRFFDFMERKKPERLKHEDVVLLTTGRHIKLADNVRLIVGRDGIENRILENFSEGRILLLPENAKGPSAIIDGDADENMIRKAASYVARYTRPKHGVRIKVIKDEREIMSIIPVPADPEEVESAFV